MHMPALITNYICALFSLAAACTVRANVRVAQVDLHFHSIDLTNVLVNLMMGEHGEMNVAALGKELSENECAPRPAPPRRQLARIDAAYVCV